MAILVNQDTRVLIQGITGNQGRYHTLRMKEYNVQVVAGSTPGRSGQQVVGVPVYDSVAEAAAHHHIDASMILVPPAGVLPAAAEAFESAIPLVVIITEFVPFHDALLIRRLSDDSPSRVIGPNTIGVISPGKGKVGVMPGFIYSEGHVGLISRSGTLTHEIASNLTYKGIGQSTCVCIGGDMVNGTNFIDILKSIPRRPPDRKSDHHRRNRRRRRRNRSPVHQGDRLSQAGHRLYRRHDRPQREKNGPCRCDRFPGSRHGGIENWKSRRGRGLHCP